MSTRFVGPTWVKTDVKGFATETGMKYLRSHQTTTNLKFSNSC